MCAQINDPKPNAERLIRRPPDRRGENGRETGIATVWLVFYGLAIGAAIVSPVLWRSFEVAMR
jgi:hypothetical protein